MAIQDQIPRSRITLTYRTTISGQPETVELPLRLLLLGDFSQIAERAEDDELEVRRIRSLSKDGLSAIMEDMALGTSVTVPGLFSSEETAELKFRSMRDFEPDRVADQVPSINALQQMRTLLMELRSKMANQRDFRKSINKLISGPDLSALINELNQNQFDTFKIGALTGPEDPEPAPAKPAAEKKAADNKDKPETS